MGKKKSDSEYTQLSLFDLEEFAIEEARENWAEGSIVKNICNNKEYTLKKDQGDIVQVFSKESGYLTMCKADIELVSKGKTEGIFFWDK